MNKPKWSWQFVFLGVFLLLIAATVQAYPGKNCAPLVGGACDIGEKCVFEPANNKWWVCEGMNPTDWLNALLNAMNFGTLICSPFGFLAGVCSAVAIPLLGLVLGAAILMVLAFAWLSVPPGPPLWVIGGIGAILGLILASFIAAWWIPIIALTVLFYYFKTKG